MGLERARVFVAGDERVQQPIGQIVIHRVIRARAIQRDDRITIRNFEQYGVFRLFLLTQDHLPFQYQRVA